MTGVPVTKQSRQGRRSFIEEARRRQIVEAAIDVIAESGYARASLERIALRADISRGLISYHFAGRDELIAAVVARIFAEGAEYIRPRVEAASTPGEMLHAHLQSSLEYMRDHRAQLIAMVEIAAGGGRGELRPGLDAIARGVNALEDILRSGQRTGEFRQFDPRVMAIAIRNVIDGVPRHMAADPDLDMDACTREIVTMFSLATAKEES